MSILFSNICPFSLFELSTQRQFKSDRNRCWGEIMRYAWANCDELASLHRSTVGKSETDVTYKNNYLLKFLLCTLLLLTLNTFVTDAHIVEWLRALFIRSVCQAWFVDRHRTSDQSGAFVVNHRILIEMAIVSAENAHVEWYDGTRWKRIIRVEAIYRSFDFDALKRPAALNAHMCKIVHKTEWVMANDSFRVNSLKTITFY